MVAMPDDYIVVTRPAPQGMALVEAIKASGGKALHFPTIAFTELTETAAFKASLAAMGEQAWLIFNSPQAVKATVPRMRRAWPVFPDTVKFAAVGSGTAKALREAGYHVAAFPEKEWSSEGLLAMPAFQDLAQQSIMVVRGVGGRKLLEKVLRERGAEVSSCMAYERVLPTVEYDDCTPLLQSGQICLIVAGSFETVNNLNLLLGDKAWPCLKSTPLLVMSERIKELATALGFESVWVANVADQQVVLDFIASKKDVLCQKKKKM